MEIAVQANDRQLAALQRRHAADRKQLSKQRKKEWRSERQAFCEQLELRRAGIVNEQDRIRLRQVNVTFYTATRECRSCCNATFAFYNATGECCIVYCNNSHWHCTV